MENSDKINTELTFQELFKKTTINSSLVHAINLQDFQNPTFCEQKVFTQIAPTEEQKLINEKQAKKLAKKIQKQKEEEERLRKEAEEAENSSEDDEDDDEEESSEDDESESEESEKQQKQKKSKKDKKIEIEKEEKEEEQKQVVEETEEQKQEQLNAKQYIVQSSYQSGKSLAIMTVQIDDFYKKIEKFDPKQIQKDQDESTHGLFSVFLCQSREVCQKTTALAETLLMKYKSKNKNSKSDNIELTQQQKNMNSNILAYNLSTLQKNQSPSIMPNKHYIIVATPSQFLKFAKTMKIEQKYYVNFTLDDLDYMISFGYSQDLNDFQFYFQQELLTTQTIVSLSSELTNEVEDLCFKLTKYGKIIDVNLTQDLQEEEKDKELKKTVEAFEREYRLVSQFYNVNDETGRYIILYVLYKLQFLSGKTLIVCHNNHEVYKAHLFLQRIGTKGCTILNEEDPKSLRYYVLSMFNTGVIQTLITTDKILQDLKNKTFFKKKRKILQFKNLSNIINMDLRNIASEYNQMYKLFRGFEGTIINLIDNHEQQIEILTQIIAEQKKEHSQINIKEFPLKKNEIDAFRYRISDIVNSISAKQIKNCKMMDFKKKLLKSKDLDDYFKENQSERQMIIEDIQSLSQQIHRYQVTCNEEIPDYLVPEMVKEQRKKFESSQGDKKFTKLQVQKSNEEFQKSLKRRMEANNLTLNDVKKKRLLDATTSGDKFVYVNNQKEGIEGEEVDANRLQVISGKKLWKQKHGFKLQKRNRRLERKGIYNK